MSTHEIAAAISEYLRALPATVTVDGAMITMEQPGRTLTIEAINDDSVLIGPSPTRGGFPTQVTSMPRVPVNRAELFKRANAWARVAA
jgi:hypothetical protein